jgi:hypothetical protein
MVASRLVDTASPWCSKLPQQSSVPSRTYVTVTMIATGSKQELKVFAKRLGKQAKLYVSDLLPPILPGG